MFDFEMPPLTWREARIPKKSGGFRKLEIPNDELKAVQRTILQYLYRNKALKPSALAHGFVPFRNTCTALTHHNTLAPVILCMDIHDFFGTFPIEPVRLRMVAAGVPATLVDKILEACTYKGHFPQGAPTSPYLTNIGMLDTDRVLAAYAKRHGYIYTRYADDITFSYKANEHPEKGQVNIFYGVEKILSSMLGIHLKKSKSHIIDIKGRAARRVTGVVIRKDGLGFNAPRRMRKNIRAGIHNLAQRIRGHKGRVYDEDHQKWKELLGYVRYMDTLRSYSPSSQVAGADPTVNETDWNYLCIKFNYMKGLDDGTVSA